MKNLELQNVGVVEMNAEEMTETDGGVNPWAIVAGIGAVYAATYAIGYAVGVTTAYVEKGLKKLND